MPASRPTIAWFRQATASQYCVLFSVIVSRKLYVRLLSVQMGL